MIKVRPSELTPSTGESNSGYYSNCYRYLAFAAELLEPEEIPDVYQLLGASGELFIRGLLELGKSKTTVLEYEQPIKLEIGDGVMFSGRVDAVESNETETIYHEIKTSMSSHLRAKIEKGEHSPNHIAQLVSYLLAHEATKGVLHVLFPKFSEKGIDFTTYFRFNVEIAGTDIIINQKKYETFDVTHITGAVQNIVRARTEKEPLPKKSLNLFACKSCPFRGVCVDHNPKTREAFRDIFNQVGPYTPKPRALPKLITRRK